MYSRKTHLKGHMDRFPGCCPTKLAVSKLCHHRSRVQHHQLNCLHGHQTHHYVFHLNLLAESYSTIVLISGFLVGNHIMETSFVLFHHSSSLPADRCSRFGGSVCLFQKNTKWKQSDRSNFSRVRMHNKWTKWATRHLLHKEFFIPSSAFFHLLLFAS